MTARKALGLILFLIMGVYGCTDDTNPQEAVVQYPGPCQIDNKRLSYDEQHRLVSITEAGVVLEQYAYTDNNTFSMTSSRPFRIVNQEQTQNITPQGTFESTFTIDPETFEMRAQAIEGTFEASADFANGTAQYNYEDTDELVPAKITVTLPPSWREGISPWGVGCAPDSPDCSEGALEIDQRPETVEGEPVLVATQGATSLTIRIGPSEVSVLVDLGSSFFDCAVGSFGIEHCISARTGEEVYSIERDGQGNITKDANGAEHGYGCWSEEDVCTKWRYVPLEAVLPGNVRKPIWFGTPTLIRVPCQWSPEVSIAAF